jgi:NADH-quinone oxidoreductase subunit G
MPSPKINLKIDGKTVTAEKGTSLIDACRLAGVEVPHYCYHPCLKAVGSCRMCVVEVKGQQKLVASCSAEAADGMEVLTDTPAVADARAGVMEFMLLNHPLDCPICDKAGECRLQDYAYRYGDQDGRTGEPPEQKSRFGFEDLGSKLVMDKNRCVHCTRCVRFLRDVAGTCELAPTNRGSHLEMAAFDGLGGAALDANPFAGNLADLCPVGALTAKGFRFRKRSWYLKPVPTISRHGADAKPIWADVDQNRVWRFRARPDGNDAPTRFISDEERGAFGRYCLDPSKRLRAPVLNGRTASAADVARALADNGPVAVVAQGAFGCGALQALAGLASSDALRYAHGNRRIPVQSPAIQKSDDAVINRAGVAALGYRFNALPELLSRLEAWEVKSVVLYHDHWFSDEAQNALLGRILQKAVFSLLLEPVPSDLAGSAKALLPVTTYLEESDQIIDHQGAAKRYAKALEPPDGVRTPSAWAAEMVRAAAPASA